MTTDDKNSEATSAPVAIQDAFCIHKGDPLAWDDPELAGERAAFVAGSASPAAPESQTIDSQTFHELAMDYRGATSRNVSEAYEALVVHIDAALAAQVARPLPAPVDGDAIAKCKNILALVDEYTLYQNAATRTALRLALMAEFEALPAPVVAAPEGWISVEDRLPDLGVYVLARHTSGTWIDPDDQANVNCVVVKRMLADKKLYKPNNLRDYTWEEFGPDKFFGQDISLWMPILAAPAAPLTED